VLDRLNALLEPNGSLSLSERGVIEGAIPTVTPHPEFRYDEPATASCTYCYTVILIGFFVTGFILCHLLIQPAWNTCLRAICSAAVNSLYFIFILMVPWRPIISECSGLIFTRFVGEWSDPHFPMPCNQFWGQFGDI